MSFWTVYYVNDWTYFFSCFTSGSSTSSVGLNEHFVVPTFDELKRQIRSNNCSTFLTPSFTIVTPAHLHIDKNTCSFSMSFWITSSSHRYNQQCYLGDKGEATDMRRTVFNLTNKLRILLFKSAGVSGRFPGHFVKSITMDIQWNQWQSPWKRWRNCQCNSCEAILILIVMWTEHKLNDDINIPINVPQNTANGFQAIKWSIFFWKKDPGSMNFFLENLHSLNFMGHSLRSLS